jgi:hypothetical protein
MANRRGYGELAIGRNEKDYLDSPSDDELDEMAREFVNRPRRERVIRQRPDHFVVWDDLDFFV